MIDPITELKKRLEKSRLSQRELAQVLAISPQFLSDILRGNRQPGDAVLNYLGLERRITYVRKGNGS